MITKPIKALVKLLLASWSAPGLPWEVTSFIPARTASTAKNKNEIPMSHLIAVLPKTTKSQAEQDFPSQEMKPLGESGVGVSWAYATWVKKSVARVRVRRGFIKLV